MCSTCRCRSCTCRARACSRSCSTSPRSASARWPTRWGTEPPMPDSYADVVRSLLTPTPTATPAEGFTRLDQPLDRGVPQRLGLDTEHEVAVLVPTGVAID